jgi:hypothetical protein
MRATIPSLERLADVVDLGEDAELGRAFQLGAGAFDVGVCALLAGTMVDLVEIAAVTPASPRTRP